jgi:adenosine deaminase/CheY-like chemotaxis protein
MPARYTYAIKPFTTSFVHTDIHAQAQKVLDTAAAQLAVERADDLGAVGELVQIYLVDVDHALSTSLSVTPDKIEPIRLPELLAGSEADLRELLPCAAGQRGLFLFLSRSTSLAAWTDPNPYHYYLKVNEFFIRILMSYQLGRFVAYPLITVQGLEVHDDAELATVLRRIVFRQQAPQQQLWTTLNDIASDIQRLYEIARREGLKGVPEPAADPAWQWETRRTFLITLGALYQLGRRPHSDTEAYVGNKAPWLEYDGAYKLKRAINEQLEVLGRSRSVDSAKGTEFARLQILLHSYEVLRDLARWLEAGATYWARSRPLRILLIDDMLETGEGVPFREQLVGIYDVLTDRGGELSIDYIASYRELDRHLWENSRLQIKRLSSVEAEPQLRRELGQGAIGDDLLSYDLILVEVEFSRHLVGPEIVRRIAAQVDRMALVAAPRPVIIALSRKENSGYIQQCLTLGAEAYVPKERIYQLPSQVAKARIGRVPAERRGHKSNFRSLYQLLPAQIAKLQSAERDQLIAGYEWDVIDRRWIDALPKADLHTHIGTCITLPVIEALAFNTSGYVLSNQPALGSVAPNTSMGAPAYRLQPRVERIVRGICRTVILAGMLNRSFQKQHPAHWLLIAAAQATRLDSAHEQYEQRTKNLPSKDPYATVIAWLTPADCPIAPFEVGSLLVAAICMAGSALPSPISAPVHVRVREQWSYLDELKEWACANQRHELAWVTQLLRTTAKRCQDITGAAWQRGPTSNPSRMNFAATDLDGGPWAQCFAMVEQRIRTVVEQLGGYFEAELAQLCADAGALGADQYGAAIKELIDGAQPTLRWPLPASVFALPALAAFVRLPDEPDARDQNLLRYLWGAGLLGAEHLQYPENILLAGKDIVQQAVEQNIVYSEIRCATNGYSAGGMSALNATDLLCAAFDLGVAYFALYKKKRWVRINLLLGAKRHKSAEQFQHIVSLLTYYLQRRGTGETDPETPSARDLRRLIPPWWRPSQVVGFDLSGDEAMNVRETEPLMLPLFTYSAPITIHAGEAKSVESVWEAVYRFRARRIGHGLHLRDNNTLLDYCITEGLCMEMCPISNKFTNGFDVVDQRFSYQGAWREHYPLRYYLQRGLDVCINTDNRQLHSAHTLTDEYLCAARMSGGLTHWEILKLIKAGFKHAFLRKHEIALLLEAVENEVYQLIVGQKREATRRDPPG